MNRKNGRFSSLLFSESYIKSYSLNKNFKYKIIRNFNTFGPGQSANSLIPSLILEGRKKNIIEVWSPETIRDFQYIDMCSENIIHICKICLNMLRVSYLGCNKLQI